MKICILTGNHLRHFYYADKLANINCELIWIIEKSENHIPVPDDYLNFHLKKLYKLHFNKRYEAEENFFGTKAGNNAENKISKIYKIEINDLSNGHLEKIVKKEGVDILLSYGCHKIPEKVIDQIKLFCWNVHGGLSPWYRGSMTHFWPSYMLEPEFTGMTLHKITKNIDGGDIILQSSVNLNHNDGIHENACRTVSEFFIELPKFIEKKIQNNNNIIGVKQKSNGRIWTNSMWYPDMLKIIYDVFDDKINKYCLENKRIKKINLIKQDI